MKKVQNNNNLRKVKRSLFQLKNQRRLLKNQVKRVQKNRWNLKKERLLNLLSQSQLMERLKSSLYQKALNNNNKVLKLLSQLKKLLNLHLLRLNPQLKRQLLLKRKNNNLKVKKRVNNKSQQRFLQERHLNKLLKRLKLLKKTIKWENLKFVLWDFLSMHMTLISELCSKNVGIFWMLTCWWDLTENQREWHLLNFQENQLWIKLLNSTWLSIWVDRLRLNKPEEDKLLEDKEFKEADKVALLEEEALEIKVLLLLKHLLYSSVVFLTNQLLNQLKSFSQLLDKFNQLELLLIEQLD